MATRWRETLAPWLTAIQSKFELLLPSLLPTRSELRDAVVVCQMSALRRDEAMCCVILEAMELLNLLAHVDAACAWKLLCDACDEPRAVHRLGLTADIVAGVKPAYGFVITYDDWDDSNTMAEVVYRLVESMPAWHHSPAFWTVKKKLMKMLPRGTTTEAVGVALWLRLDDMTRPYDYQLDCMEDACALMALLKSARARRDHALPFYVTSCSVDFGEIPLKDIETVLLVTAAMRFFVASVTFGAFESQELRNYSQLEFSSMILNMSFDVKHDYQSGIQTLHVVPSTLCNLLDIECVFLGIGRSETLEVVTFDDKNMAKRTPDGVASCEDEHGNHAKDTSRTPDGDTTSEDEASTAKPAPSGVTRDPGAIHQPEAFETEETPLEDPDELREYWIEGVVAAVFNGCGTNKIRRVSFTFRYCTLEDIPRIREKLEYATRHGGIEPEQWHVDDSESGEDQDSNYEEIDDAKKKREPTDAYKPPKSEADNAPAAMLLPPEPPRRYSTHCVRHLSLKISGDTTLAFVSALLWIGGEPLTRLDLHGSDLHQGSDRALMQTDLKDVLTACRKLRRLTLESFEIESLAPLVDPSSCPRSLESLVIVDSAIQARDSIQHLFQALRSPTHSLYLTLRDLCIREQRPVDIETCFKALKMLQNNRRLCRFMIGASYEPLVARLHDAFDRYNGRPVVHEAVPIESKLAMVYLLKRSAHAAPPPAVARACLSPVFEFAALPRTRTCALVLS